MYYLSPLECLQATLLLRKKEGKKMKKENSSHMYSLVRAWDVPFLFHQVASSDLVVSEPLIGPLNDADEACDEEFRSVSLTNLKPG